MADNEVIETPFTPNEGGEENVLLLSDDKVKEGQLKTVYKKHLSRRERIEKWRNFAGFWILGLCNNFPYVVMLSAAYDILEQLEHKNSDKNDLSETVHPKNLSSCVLYLNETTNSTYYLSRECLPNGTYQILLADILPTFIIKLIVPYFMHYFPYWIRVLTVVLFNSASYITVALADSITVVLLGVVFASISSGLGEITFLAFTARYDKSTVAGWSSGTGASGVGAALVYTGLSAFLSPKVSILIQLITPVIMELSYLFLLGKPNEIVDTLSKDNNEEGGNTRGGDSEDEENESETNSKDTLNLLDNQPVQSDTGKRQIKLVFLQKPKVSLVKHLKCIPRVFFYYMIWLFLVYASEYMINHSLHESLYYPNTHIGNYCLQQNIQYKWYQVTYQLGVFLSRTSILLFHIKYFHFLAILQAVNFIFLLLEVVYQFIPSFWITLFIVLYEGLLGGGVYANAFYSISKRVDPIHKEFAMGVASAADSTGITVAGGLSHFVHDFICSLGY